MCALYYTYELIKEHNDRVIGSTAEGEEGDELDGGDKMPIKLLKEEDINCSYRNGVNSKSNLLNYTEKGVFKLARARAGTEETAKHQPAGGTYNCVFIWELFF